mmetsp:Transcript_5074/g.15953  ORF Transcript_5074/g.15953 Transcript_5074/m.15953 type:complete len:304 (-) Transcript_5074:100-1011(-)
MSLRLRAGGLVLAWGSSLRVTNMFWRSTSPLISASELRPAFGGGLGDGSGGLGAVVGGAGKAVDEEGCCCCGCAKGFAGGNGFGGGKAPLVDDDGGAKSARSCGSLGGAGNESRSRGSLGGGKAPETCGSLGAGKAAASCGGLGAGKAAEGGLGANAAPLVFSPTGGVARGGGATSLNSPKLVLGDICFAAGASAMTSSCMPGSAKPPFTAAPPLMPWRKPCFHSLTLPRCVPTLYSESPSTTVGSATAPNAAEKSAFFDASAASLAWASAAFFSRCAAAAASDALKSIVGGGGGGGARGGGA